MTYDINQHGAESRDSGFDHLAALENRATAIDSEIAAEYAPQLGGDSAAEVIGGYDAELEAKSILSAVALAASPFYPSLAKIYTDAQIDAIAKAAAPVMRKYNVTAGGVFEQWGPEIGLAMVVIPVGLQTVAAIRHDREQAAIAAQQPQPETASNDAQVTAAA